MENPQPTARAVSEAVSEARALVREQVAALWQLQVERVREQLESGWREHLDRIFDERFTDVESRLHEQLRRASSSTTDALNQTARRMRQAENREVWIQAFLERATDFCSRAALFAVKGRSVRYEGGAGFEGNAADCTLDEAPAFASAVETKDPVVAAATASELSPAVAQLAGEGTGRKAYIFPFSFRGQVVGLLYAEGNGTPVDVSGLELLTALAETTIEPESEPARPAEPLVGIAAAPPPAADIAALALAEQERHARAQRFARTRVANIMLFQMNRVKDGRAANTLYGTLKDEIDAAREAYREQFITGGASLPDYLHQELVATLAKGDATALGASYPGPLA